MTTSADLGILYLAGQQAQPEITHNGALNQLQVLLSGVISAGLNTPPGSPTQGDTYILGASPTGVWAGRANCLAGYFGTGWIFVPGNDSAGTPIAMGARQEGLRVWNKATDSTYVWSGSAWAASGGGGSGSITVQDEGSTLTTAVTKFNFVGAGVTVTEPVADEVTVTIAGGGGGPGTPPTIVQTAISNAASTSITLTSAPTNGNLLVAICQSGSAAQGAGWTLQSSSSTGIYWGVVATKVAGAGESTTQTPIAAAGGGPVIMIWEIAGAAASPVIVASADFRVAAVNGSSTLVPSVSNTLMLFGNSLEGTGIAFTYKANYTEDRNLTSGFNASMGHSDASTPVYGALLQWASSTTMRPSYIMLKS